MSHPSTASDDKSDLGVSKDEPLSQTTCVALENVVWRKLDRRILPLCTCLYLLASVDRANIGNARIVGLQESLNISNYQYTLALTLTYISYMAAEFPFTLILKHVGPDLMLPTMAVLWGVASASQGLIKNYTGLLVCRFFLGLFEGGLPPGLILYLSFFYPRKRLQTRVTVYCALASLSGAFSGLLAAAIDQLNGKGGKPGWAWIFILEGTVTFVFGVACFFFLPRTPERAHFLTEQERAYLISTLKQSGSISEDETLDQFSWTEIARAAKSPHLWLLSIVFFLSGTIVFGLTYFEPTIVASLGYSGNQAQLMSVPPFAAATILSFILAIISDHHQCRGFTAIFSSLLEVIGFTMFYASTSNNVRYASLFFSVPGAFCAAPALATWLVNNTAPHTRRATGVGITYVMTELGAILATWLLGWLSPAPRFTTATVTFVAMSIGMVVFSMATLVYLWQENLKKAEKRTRMRKEDEVGDLGDRSAWFIYSL